MDQIIASLQENNSSLKRRLSNLDADGQTSLYNFISMFDADQSGHISSAETSKAANILGLLRYIDQDSLRDLIALMRTIDFNENAVAEHNERKLAHDILTIFAGSDEGDDGTVNRAELAQAMNAVRSFDRNNNGHLSKEERSLLKEAMKRPEHLRSLG